jgi:hypothetical protein
MCDKFKNHVVGKIHEELEQDMFYIRILAVDFGIFVHPCAFKYDMFHSETCKRIYVKGPGTNEEGYQCITCNKYICKNCIFGKAMVTKECSECWQSKQDQSLFDKIMHCKFCKGNELCYIRKGDNFYCKRCKSLFSCEALKALSQGI